MKKVCVFTGTRAEYGLLTPLINQLKLDKEVELQILVSGMHMSPEFGLTFKEIEKDGFLINDKVEMVLSADTPTSICKSMGLGLIGFADALKRLRPDCLIVLGDRYETFCAAVVAMVMRIPIVHIQGGELSFGAIDDCMRHSISKMSWLHFTFTEQYRKRVIQLGEQPHRVFNFGALNSEVIEKMNFSRKEEFEKEINFNLGDFSCLVTFHPVTLEFGTAENQFAELLSALDARKDLRIVFTKSNSDTEGRVINFMIDDFVKNNPNRAIQFTSMGQRLYLNAMKHVDIVIGNSSSGIIETPSFKVATINIGDRQKGRCRADNVIDCDPNSSDIQGAIEKTRSSRFLMEVEKMNNPFYKKDTSKNIKEVILMNLNNVNLKKVFFDN